MKTAINHTVKGFDNAIINEDEENYFIDLKTGLGESIYPKDSFSLSEAIEDAVNYTVE